MGTRQLPIKRQFKTKLRQKFQRLRTKRRPKSKRQMNKRQRQKRRRRQQRIPWKGSRTGLLVTKPKQGKRVVNIIYNDINSRFSLTHVCSNDVFIHYENPLILK